MGELNTPGIIPPEHNPELAFLLNRRSCHKLMAPGPGADALELILRAALRAPDFLRLRPFRFLVARDGGLDRLGQAMQRAAIAAGKDEATVARAPDMPRRAPLLITVVFSPKPSETVPLFDQELCAGSAVLMMQMAARAQGFGAVWRSGWLMFDPGFHRELGLAAQERIAGFLYIGTPAHPEPARSRPDEDLSAFTSWI